jgi:hypothetical protein
MNADENIKIWAGGRVGVDPAAIVDIRFEREPGYSYSEYTYVPGYIYAEVRTKTACEQIPLNNVSFIDIIQEIYEAGEQSP